MKTLKKLLELFLECQYVMAISSFSVMPEMSSFRVIFGKRLPLLYWQKDTFIFVGKKITSFTNIQKTSCFHVFFEKDYLLLSFHKKDIIFSGKRNVIFRHNKRKILFQCIFFFFFFWKDHLFRTFEEYIIFPCIFLRKIVFHFPPKE